MIGAAAPPAPPFEGEGDEMKVRKSRNLRLLLCLLAAGCSTWAYQNEPLPDASKEKAAKDTSPAPPVRATFALDDKNRMKEDVVVCLALSGGGSRAAWFSSAVMFELAKIETDPDLLAQVDVISSVSGGSLAAAYFASSQDPAPRARLAAPPRAALPKGTDSKLEYDQKTRLLTVKDELTDDEGKQLRAACDPADTKRIDRLVVASRGCVSKRDWDYATVRELMTRNYVRRLFWNFFWPQNIALYWTTAYDRGDIMAETFADNLFDRKGFGTGKDLTFADLNPVRPSLILNSTDGTDDPKPVDAAGKPREQGRTFGDVFAFTRETFQDQPASDLSKFPLGYAVMSSASFPGAFPYRTMRDFTAKPSHDPAYVHVFDGGNSDNLGLKSVKRALFELQAAGRLDRYKKVVVLLVDAYAKPSGQRRSDHDPRALLGRLLDPNLLQAVDSLLQANRNHLIDEFRGRVLRWTTDCAPASRTLPTRLCDQLEDLPGADLNLGDKMFFYHFGFDSLEDPEQLFWSEGQEDIGKHGYPELKARLDHISTSFSIGDEEAGALASAVETVLTRYNPCLATLHAIVRSEPVELQGLPRACAPLTKPKAQTARAASKQPAVR